MFSKDRSECIKGLEASLVLKDDACLYFHKPYAIPYAIKDAVSNELDKLVKEGILILKKQSEIASPIVVVPKKNGEIRICVDFKKTLYPNLITDQYPLPTLRMYFIIYQAQKYTQFWI